MALPILNIVTAPTTETLIRHFHQTQSNWTAHLSERTVLDIGSAWTSAELRRVQIANRILDAALPAGMTPREAMQQAEAHFASQGTQCLQWVMNPSSPPEQTSPTAEFLVSQGYETRVTNIMYLNRVASAPPAGTAEDLTIIPSRASFKHARMLHEEALKDRHEPQLVEARMMHLDDPHYDALLALKDGEPVACVGVLAVGEIGLIAQLFVSAAYRGRGIAKTMMRRALEICARSLFKHVLLDVLPQDARVIKLYEDFGFRTIGQFIAYQKQPS